MQRYEKSPNRANDLGIFFHLDILHLTSYLGHLTSYIPVLLLGIEARTVLADARQVTVAQDDGLGVVDAQRLQQGVQGSLLLGGAGVLGSALGVQSALVADADGVLVVVAGVGTDEVLVARLVHLAVAGDVVVVAGESKAAVVAGDERRHRERLVLPRRTAVNDYQINLSHIAHRYLVVNCRTDLSDLTDFLMSRRNRRNITSLHAALDG